MKYLLDTNVLSELLKFAPAKGVVEWVRGNQDLCGMSALTLAEMAKGVALLPDGKRRNYLAKELLFLQEDYADRILPFDESAAWEWARYMVEVATAGYSPPLLDSLLAATAKAMDLIVVTRNVSDFPLIRLINPFDQSSKSFP